MVALGFGWGVYIFYTLPRLTSQEMLPAPQLLCNYPIVILEFSQINIQLLPESIFR